MHLPTIELVLQMGMRGGALLLIATALEFLTTKGKRLVLCTGVACGVVAFTGYHGQWWVGSNWNGWGLLVGVSAASVTMTLLLLLMCRAPKDLIVAGSLVIQAITWLLMIDPRNPLTPLTGGELGVDAPKILGPASEGWGSIVMIVGSVALAAGARAWFWDSRDGVAAERLEEDRHLALMVGVSEARVAGVVGAFSSVCLAFGAIGWLATYKKLQAAPFSLELAMLVALAVMVASRPGRRSWLYVFVVLFVAVSVLVRTYCGELGPTLERLILGLALLAYCLGRFES